MVISLLTKLDMENGGTGAPTVVTPGQIWIFRGFIADTGGAPQSGQFKVNGGALTTYNIGSTIGANDNPSIDITTSPRGSYLFEYNIVQCDIGSTLTISNTTCPTCNAGSSSAVTVCNGACTVNLFNYLTGGPDAGGAWTHVSGPQTLTFTGGDVGTVNFSGKTAGTYVARYTVLTCTVDITITVQAPPNAGNDVTVDRCDSDAVVVDFEASVGGTVGTWTATSVLPSFGVVNIAAKTYTPADGDGGIVPSSGTYGTPKIYTFEKTVTSAGIVSECANVCNDTAVLTVRVFPRFQSGTNALNNVICNDGSQRNLRDLLNGEDAGGQWDFFGVLYTAGGGGFTADLIINGVNTPGYTGTGSNFLFGGADNGTIGFMPGSPAGDYRFRYKLPNQNTACGGIAQVGFAVQACTPTCTGNNPTIVQNISGNCVNATRGGSVSNLATEQWTYRTSSNGAFIGYTPGTNVCGQAYVEFQYVLTFNGGCPSIQRSTTYNQNNPTCNNNPTVSGAFNSCAFTLTPGGTITSPISSSIIQWRYLTNTNWNTYSGPIAVSGTATIEFRRIVSYSDGCPQSTTAVQQITGQCGSSCVVSIGINSNNNLLTANTSGCGQAGQSIDWYYSVNGVSYGGIVGTGFSFTPSAAGYYKAILTCGTCTDEDIYQWVGGGNPCTGSAGLSYNSNNGVLTATRSGCAGTVSYDWRYSPTGSGWSVATGNVNSATLTAQDGPGFYRVFTFCNGDCLLTADFQINSSGCNNNPTVSCQYNTTTCLYTLQPGGSNGSPILNDDIEWKEVGSLVLHIYGGPFANALPIEYRRRVDYFDTCPTIETPFQTCSGSCCSGNTMDVNCSFNTSTSTYTLTNTQSLTNAIIADGVRWRPQGQGAWNNYTGPFVYNGPIEYDRTVTLSGGCGSLYSGIKTCGSNPCTGNTPGASCSFNVGDCKYTLTLTGTNVSAVATNVLRYRAQGSGTWINYTVPFVLAGPIEYQRIVTYSNGCPAVDTGVLTCSGNCCPSFTLNVTLNGSNQLVANTGTCGGTITTTWYFGPTAGSTNTQVGTGSTLTPVNGAGFYKAVSVCSAGNCTAESTYQLGCSSSATLNFTSTDLDVVGLSGCPSPSYSWQYSTNGSGGWTTASGATNSGHLSMANGNGWYRVTITCNGICPIVLSYQRAISVCQDIAANFGGGGSLDVSQQFISTGSGTVTMYFSPGTYPDRFQFRRNGVMQYDSGCITNAPAFDTGGYGCPSVIYGQPVGATFIPDGAPENPFPSIVAWKISFPVSLNDLIQIDVESGCTGCPGADSITGWYVSASCSF